MPLDRRLVLHLAIGVGELRLLTAAVGGGGEQGPQSRVQAVAGGAGTELSKPGGAHRGTHGDGLVLDLENVTMLGEDDRDEFFIGDDDEQEMCK